MLSEKGGGGLKIGNGGRVRDVREGGENRETLW